MKQKQIKPILIYTLLFLFIAAIGYGPMLANGHSLIWRIDGIGQYYPAFLYIGKYIRTFLSGLLHGQIVLPLYDLSIGFGEDIIGTLNYYGFGDPLNILAVFATASNGAYIFTGLFFLRGWIAGAVLYRFFKELGYKSVYAVCGALSYPFCGFSVFGAGRYAQWYDLVIIIPLLFLGCELVLNRKKNGKVCLALFAAYAGLCSIYFLYISAILLFLYCPVRLTLRYGLRNWKTALKNCVLLLLICMAGVLLSAPILFPEVSSFFGSENSEYSVIHTILNGKYYIPVSFPEIWYSLINPFYCTSTYSYAGGIHLFETAAIVILLIKRNKTAREKVIAAVFAAEIAALHFPIVGLVFNAFNETNNRWIVILHLTIALIFTHCMQFVFEEKLAVLKKQKLVLPAVSLLTAVNIGVIVFLSFSPLGLNWGRRFILFDEAYSVYIDSPVCYSEIVENDSDLFRVSSALFTRINNRPPNSAMVCGYNSLQYWFSVSNTYTQKLVDYSYDAEQVGRAYGVNKNRYLNSLLGVKYYFARSWQRPPGFRRKETIYFNSRRWIVYENRNYNGMAYLRNADRADRIWSDFENDNDLDRCFKRIYRLYRKYTKRDKLELKYITDRFICSAQAEGNEELVFAIPYNTNWKAYIDGKKAETERRDIMFTAVRLESGEHEVVLKYVPVPFYLGCICSAMIVIVYLIRRRLLKRTDQAAS